MAALTADASRKTRNLTAKSVVRFPVGTGNTIYKGSLVAYMETTERVLAGTAAVTRKCFGIAEHGAVGVTDGSVFVDITYGYEVLLDKAAALTGAYVGANVAIDNDNTVTTASDAGTAGVQVLVGECIEIDGSQAWVRLRSFTTTAV